MRLLFCACTFLFCFSIYSQQKKSFTSYKIGLVETKKAKELDMMVKVQNLEAPNPDGNSTRSYIQRRKELVEQRFPRNNVPSGKRELTSEDTIGVGLTFITNTGPRGIPNDNSMAISDSGVLISCFNSSIYIHDTKADTIIDEISLDFFRDQIGLTDHSFDPKIVYDPDHDRFILVFLIGSTVATSNIIVCFSSSENPMDAWSVYALDGNPLNDASWSDYPAIAITKEDLFITMNLLVEGGSWQTSFKQTVVWQVKKEEAYNGDTAILSDLWFDIKEGGINIRNMHPVRGGYDIKSPNQYFLSNRNFALDSDTIYLVEITNSYSSGQATMNISLLRSDVAYHFGPNARQIQGSFQRFQTNDSRVLGGIVENNQIQFVQNTAHPATGNAAVYHGVISNVLTSPSVKGRFIYDDSTEFGYPNIAYGGIKAGEDKAVIGFNHSSLWKLPGHSAVYFDGEHYSEIKTVKAGEGYVSSMGGYNQRWGDYTGIQRMYSQPCKIWMNGYFGGANHQNYSWASELILPGDCSDTLVIAPQQNGNVFPNPTTDLTEVHFSLNADKNVRIELLNQYGDLVKLLLSEKLNAGENRLSFSTKTLAQGIYILRIYSDREKILVKKIIKN